MYCWNPYWNLQAVLVAAYCRRLERLASLLRQYDSHLQQARAALGLAQQLHEQGEEPRCKAVASAGLADCLRQVGEELAEAAAAAAPGAPTPDALLELGGGCAPPAARLATAGAGAILDALQGECQGQINGCVICWVQMDALPGPTARTCCLNHLCLPHLSLLLPPQRPSRLTWLL